MPTLDDLPRPGLFSWLVRERFDAALPLLRKMVAPLTTFATVADLLADTSLSYTTGGRRVAAGDVIHATSQGLVYRVATSTATDQHLTTAGGVRLYVLPVRGAIHTAAFPGNIGAQFNAAVAAAKYWRQVSANTAYWHDTPRIVITPGSYALDATLLIEDIDNLHVDARGVRISNATASTCLVLRAAPRCVIDGLSLDLRSNNSAAEGILLAGQCSYAVLRDIKITANTTNTGFAAIRAQQGDLAGLDNNNRDKGNFWVTFDRVWVRKLQGADPNSIPVGIDLQGAQNAVRIVNCSFTHTDVGVQIRNQNGSTTSGVSNDVQIHHTAFEVLGIAVLWTSTVLTTPIPGGTIAMCRFENITTAVQSALTAVSSLPVLLIGNTYVNPMANHVVDANPQLTGFNVLDQGLTPNTIQPRFSGVRGLFVGSTSSSGFPALAVRAKQVTDGGGSLVIQRDDGTKDGGLSQRSGGGLDIDGGSTNRVRVAGMSGLSGNSTHAVNFRGSATMAAAATTVAVTFGTAEPDATYHIFYAGRGNRRFWTTGHSTTGFTINTDAAPSSNETVGWMLVR